jgi:hypothetical protein
MAGDADRSEHVQELVGERTEPPEQSVASEVVDGGIGDGELSELLDVLLDDGSRVVAAPCRHDVDALDVREDVRALVQSGATPTST